MSNHEFETSDALSDKGVLKLTKCERYPSCICIPLNLNPEAAGPENGADLLARVQKELGGGMCPHSESTVCMWADLCAQGKDPTSWAEYLATGKMTDDLAIQLARRSAETR